MLLFIVMCLSSEDEWNMLWKCLNHCPGNDGGLQGGCHSFKIWDGSHLEVFIDCLARLNTGSRSAGICLQGSVPHILFPSLIIFSWANIKMMKHLCFNTNGITIMYINECTLERQWKKSTKILCLRISQIKKASKQTPIKHVN